MQAWPVHTAKARFSEMLNASLQGGPQLVTVHGAEKAVLVSLDEWRALKAAAKPSLKDVLLQAEARTDDMLIPKRGAIRRREPRPL